MNRLLQVNIVLILATSTLQAERVTFASAPLHTHAWKAGPGYSYTQTYRLTGWPSTVVRCGTSSEGMPIGLQVVAGPWREDVSLAVAKHLEAALGGWRPTSL